MIRLSLLPTSHPLSFQPKWVRSSTQYNPRFNLLMGRSPGFASTTYNIRPIKTRFPYGFGPEGLNQAANGNSPDHYAKGTPSHITSKLVIVLRPLVGIRFQILFHSPSGGTFHLSVTLLSLLSVVREYLALRDGPRRFSPGST